MFKKLLVGIVTAVMLFGCMGTTGYRDIFGPDYAGECKTEIRRYLPEGKGSVVVTNQSELNFKAILDIEEFINSNNDLEDVEVTHFAYAWDEEYQYASAVLLLSTPHLEGWVPCTPNFGYIVEINGGASELSFDEAMTTMGVWVPSMDFGPEGVQHYLDSWSE